MNNKTINIISVDINKIVFTTNFLSDMFKNFSPYINLRTYQYEMFPCIENIELLLGFSENIIETPMKEKLFEILMCLEAPKNRFNNELELSTLRDYQIEDLEKLINLNGGANFSEQRTGKTPVAILTLKNLNKKSIIVCPSSIQLLTWEPQLKQFANKEPILMFKKVINSAGLIKNKPLNSQERLNKYLNFFESSEVQYLVVSKDTLKLDIDNLLSHISIKPKSFNLLIDEAHFFKAHKSTKKTTKQCKAIISLRKHCDRVYALTGTPSAHHPSDIFGIMNLIHPERFKSYYDFVSYFWGFDNFNKPVDRFNNSNQEKWLTNVVSKYATMRKQKEVMNWLPEIIKEQVVIPMTDIQAKMYYDVFVYFMYNDILTPSILTQISWLRQISNAAVSEDGKFLGSGKINWLKDYMKENSDEKLLILTQFSNKTIPYIANELEGENFEIITGATPKQEMRDIIDRVQNGATKHLISNIQVIKEGITLDKIDTIIFFDRLFNPNDNAQVEARFIPTTAKDNRETPKRIIDLISENPVDFSHFLGTDIHTRLTKTLDDSKILDMLQNKIDITKYLNNLGKEYESYE